MRLAITVSFTWTRALWAQNEQLLLEQAVGLWECTIFQMSAPFLLLCCFTTLTPRTDYQPAAKQRNIREQLY